MKVINLEALATQNVEFMPEQEQRFTFDDGLSGVSTDPECKTYEDYKMITCAIKLDDGGWRSIFNVSSIN